MSFLKNIGRKNITKFIEIIRCLKRRFIKSIERQINIMKKLPNKMVMVMVKKIAIKRPLKLIIMQKPLKLIIMKRHLKWIIMKKLQKWIVMKQNLIRKKKRNITNIQYKKWILTRNLKSIKRKVLVIMINQSNKLQNIP